MLRGRGTSPQKQNQRTGDEKQQEAEEHRETRREVEAMSQRKNHRVGSNHQRRTRPTPLDVNIGDSG